MLLQAVLSTAFSYDATEAAELMVSLAEAAAAAAHGGGGGDSSGNSGSDGNVSSGGSGLPASSKFPAKDGSGSGGERGGSGDGGDSDVDSAASVQIFQCAAHPVHANQPPRSAPAGVL